MKTSVFLPEIWQKLLPLPEGQPAQLEGYALCHDDKTLLPVLVAAAARCEGALYVLSELADFAALFSLTGAQPDMARVQTERASVSATVFVVETAERPAWHALDELQIAILQRALREMAALAARVPPEGLRARWPMALAHAASVGRAALEPAPASLRRVAAPDEIALMREYQPYAWFFGVREDDLKFRRFNGDFSQEVKRAGFLMSDAVMVLPYDVKRDRVMLVEQFRYGPWLRGAPNPWSLEAIAGRVDAFETPEQAALREAEEEAGLTLRPSDLRKVVNMYPSPGAITEFMFQFVALCDLPDGITGVSGLDSEAEDIRSHVIPFAELMALVESGEAQNGPLVLTAYWLTLNRDRLRAEGMA